MPSPFSSKRAAGRPTADGLVVYKDGKIIYRQGASPRSTGGFRNKALEDGGSASRLPVELAPEVAGTFLTLRVEPHYPDRARRQNIQGPVVLQALINEDGSVQQLKVLTGNSDLAVAAIDAVRNWRFRPYSPKGKPSQFATRITVNFALPGAQQMNN
jgi:TonB family protein